MSTRTPPSTVATAPITTWRIGHGYDIHRLEALPPAGQGRPLVLGGLLLPCDRGPIAHSDGDAVLHAITDAILGALAQPDLGTLFPDSDPRHADQSSRVFLAEAIRRMHSASLTIGNVDVTVVCERPKLSPHRDVLRDSIADLLGCPATSVNIKGKTHERVDAVGEERAIEVHVVALLRPVG